MKLATVMVAMGLVLGACNSTRNPAPDTPRMDSFRIGMVVNSVRGGASYSELGVWVDPTSGCQYYTGEVQIGIALSPRIGKDRQPICDDGASLTVEAQRVQFEVLRRKFEVK
jgi:hypothetical protein